MNIEKIAYFTQQYSQLGDEALAHLIVTRRSSLSEEALHALTTVLKGRGSDGLQQEMRATASDLAGQDSHARQLVRKSEMQARRMRKAWHLVCAGVVVGGLALAVFDDVERGAMIIAAGVCLFLYMELRRGLGIFLRALFNMR